MIDNCQICGNQEHTLFMKAEDQLKSELYDLFKCNKCDLISVHPLPSDQKLSNYYKKDYYGAPEKGIIGYFERSLKNKVFKKHLKEIEKRSKKGLLLDLGCGNAYFLKFAKNSNWDIQGVEMSPDASQFANKQGLNVMNSSIETANLPKNNYDVITMFNVLEHLKNLNVIMKHNYDILKNDGTLLIEIPNIESLQLIIFNKNWCHLDLPRHIYHFKRKTFEILAKKHGFKIVHEYSIPFSLHEVAGWILSLSSMLKKKNNEDENKKLTSRKFNIKSLFLLLIAHISRIIPPFLIFKPGVKTYILKKDIWDSTIKETSHEKKENYLEINNLHH
ncbi:MAG: class I SAM-dependent methyltransferase [Nanoarchaeota archaeon]|nr:class I SAM-dependent methyltransferase [Nanoarchaeota archaeon]